MEFKDALSIFASVLSIVAIVFTVFIGRSDHQGKRARSSEVGIRLAVITLIALVGGGTAGYILQEAFEKNAGRDLSPDLIFIVPLLLMILGVALVVRYLSLAKTRSERRLALPAPRHARSTCRQCVATSPGQASPTQASPEQGTLSVDANK